MVLIEMHGQGEEMAGNRALSVRDMNTTTCLYNMNELDLILSKVH